MTKKPDAGLGLALTLRIGVTGARRLSLEQMPRIREEATGFLRCVRGEMERLARDPGARAVYLGADEGMARSHLNVVSPLAEGADRLLAEVGLEEGFALSCPIPFARSEYETDFPSEDSRRQFRSLLGRAEPFVLALDGMRGASQVSSYEAVGRHVVRNCDVLIAIWDGLPGEGAGGTADMVRFAAEHGPPVWWIHAEKATAPVLLIGGRPARAAASEALRSYLARLILPPAAVETHPHTWFERAAKVWRPAEPASFVKYRTPTPNERWIWQAHGWLMRTMARGAPVASTPPRPEPAGIVERFWFGHFRAADDWAEIYVRRYRSVYVWVFALAAIAVIFASIALVVPSTVPIKLAVTGIEFASLVLIAILVLASERHRWHRQFLEFRLLAELCRKQQALALFGWSLPGPAVAARPDEPRPSEAAAPSSGDAWVGWLFGALQRAAPTLQGAFEVGRSGQAREVVIRDVIDDQLNYHRNRAIESQRASTRLAQIGELFFIAVLVLVLIKLALVVLHAGPAIILSLGLAAAILPALSAGFVGIRSYMELSLLADQSRRIQAEMSAARSRVQEIDVTSPLASQALGSEMFSVAALMLRDIQWSVQLFSTKVVEPG